MAKVGSIKQYHSGAAYDVANIYDAKQTSMPGATKVLMHFDSSATQDECGNTWTAVTSKKCLYVDENNYIQLNSFNIGGADFTIDYWGYCSGDASFFSMKNGESLFQYYHLGLESWYANVVSSGYYLYIRSFILNSWNHVAIVYEHSAGTVKTYVNGVLGATHTGKSIPAGDYGPVCFGKTVRGCIGSSYIDEFRISNIARWTANFTPPTGNYTKDSYTKVLMHFDSSVTADDCGNTWTTSGSPTLADKPLLSAATKKFGNSSLYLDGNSYLQMTGGITLKANEKWYISFWHFKTQVNRYDAILTDSNGGYLYSIQTSDSSANNQIGMRFNYNYYNINAGEMPLNAWTHIYIDNDGNGNVAIYVNGTRKAYSAVNRDFILSANVQLGRFTNFPSIFGYIDEFIIGVGKQLYTANFTPPTSAYSVDAAITVNGNMMIRHNNANCYIPLTTTQANTSVPCLTVRHNNANYYAIK